MKLFTSLALFLMCTLGVLGVNPIVIVPGIAGNGLFAELTKASVPDCFSDYSYGSYRVWIQLRFFAYGTKCWAKTVSLLNDKTKYYGHPGVRVNAHMFGNLRDVDYLDYVSSYGLAPTKYIGDLTYALIQTKKYKGGLNLFGAPYDWRFPMHESHGLNRLKSLIETASELNANKKVIILGHSQGTARVMWLLNKHSSKEWKDQYVERFVAVNGVFGGSFKSVKGVVSGYAELLAINVMGYNTTLVDPILIRDIFRSLGAAVTLQPNKKLFGADHQVLSYQPSPKGVKDGLKPIEFSLKQYPVVLPENDNFVRDRMFEDQSDFETALLTDPGVPVQCMWSIYNEPTTDVRFQYMGDDLESALAKDPIPFTTFGDNTVPLRSISICSRWSQTKLAVEFRNMDHQAILKEPLWIAFTSDLLQRDVKGGYLPDDVDLKAKGLDPCEDCGEDDDEPWWVNNTRLASGEQRLLRGDDGQSLEVVGVAFKKNTKQEAEEHLTMHGALDSLILKRKNKLTQKLNKNAPAAELLTSVSFVQLTDLIYDALSVVYSALFPSQNNSADSEDSEKEDQRWPEIRNLPGDDSPHLDPSAAEPKDNPCLIYQAEMLVHDPENPDILVNLNNFVKAGDMVDLLTPHSIQARAKMFRTCIHTKKSVLSVNQSSLPNLVDVVKQLRQHALSKEVVLDEEKELIANVRANALAESSAIHMRINELSSTSEDSDTESVVAAVSQLREVFAESRDLLAETDVEPRIVSRHPERPLIKFSGSDESLIRKREVDDFEYSWDLLLPTNAILNHLVIKNSEEVAIHREQQHTIQRF